MVLSLDLFANFMLKYKSKFIQNILINENYYSWLTLKDIEFLKHEALEPNLFLPKEDDYEIPLFLNKDKKEIA